MKPERWMVWLCVLLIGQGTSAVSAARHAAAPSSLVSPARLEAHLRAYLSEHLESRDIVLTVRVLHPREPVAISATTYTLEVSPNPFGIRTGRRAFRVDVRSGEHLVQRIHVVAEIKAVMEVVTPTRWIASRHLLSEADLTVTRMALPTLRHEYVRTIEEAVGKRTIRPLSPNRPIDRSSLSLPPVIRKGDRVIIQARRSGLLVQAVGVAKSSGTPGETIAVRNQTSGREVLGIVVRAGLVEVSF